MAAPAWMAVATRWAGLGASAPSVARWLGDVRTYFPTSVVRVMQQDAMDRLGLRQLLLEPEMLDCRAAGHLARWPPLSA